MPTQDTIYLFAQQHDFFANIEIIYETFLSESILKTIKEYLTKAIQEHLKKTIE